MNNPESSKEASDELRPDGTHDEETASELSQVEPQLRRRRRSDRNSPKGLFARAGSRDRGRSRGRGRSSKRLDAERFMVISSFILIVGLAAFGGYWFGSKSVTSGRADVSAPKYEEVVPSAESDSLVDSGFAELSSGDFRKAFLDFQKVQESQATLPGIDFLVGNSALQAGEVTLAKESLGHAISKNEMDAEARVLMALITLEESDKNKDQGGPNGGQMTDPLVTAESELRRYASTHPTTASIYRKWAEIHRHRGSYRTAADLLHKAVIRADLDDNISLLSAKEILTKLQNQPSKEAPSLALITSMSGEQAMGAALSALQNKSGSDAVFFLERAREYYTPRIFKELMKDIAFDEYRTDPKFEKFLKSRSP